MNAHAGQSIFWRNWDLNDFWSYRFLVCLLARSLVRSSQDYQFNGNLRYKRLFQKPVSFQTIAQSKKGTPRKNEHYVLIALLRILNPKIEKSLFESDFSSGSTYTKMTCHQPSSKSIFRHNFDENIRNLVISEANDNQYCIILLFYARNMVF